ncbi:probable 18S rRNA (guanine-N(7))-methyltransferase, partial [Tanacetum coccineum]
MSSRPELQAPPEIFYDDVEARKYTSSSRIVGIQAELSERALELLALPDDDVPRLLLDIGCGSGLSGETISENGHQWIGLDISRSMLDVALERETDGDLILGDMGQGLGIRPGVIDGAISISAVQWLCNADKSCHEPRLRLKINEVDKDSEDDEEVCVVTSMNRGSGSGEGTSKGLPKMPRHEGPMDMFFARKPEDVLTGGRNLINFENE